MRDCSGSVMRARCDTIGMVLRVLFWGYVLYVVFILGLGIWCAFQPADQFVLYLADTGNGLAGFAYLNGGFEMDFVRNMLTGAATEQAKAVYMAGVAEGSLMKLFTLAILWNIQSIFRRIDQESTPFVQLNCRALFRAGVIVILAGLVRSTLLPVVFGIMGVGNGGQGTAWIQSILAGGVIICLSYIFEYGTALQIQSDETL